MKKNIVFILADQLRQDFCGCYGADWLSTPNIDKLASEGVLYQDAVSPSPACVPVRASLMTGMSALENRVLDNGKWLRPDRLAMGIETLPEKLVKNGYHTAAIGKMHFYPWDICEGFRQRVIAEDKRHTYIQDDYTIFLKKHGYDRYHANVYEGFYDNKGAVVSTLPDELNIDKFVCDQTIDYLKAIDKENPFMLMVGFPGPHCPYDPTQAMIDKLPEGKACPKAVPVTKDTTMLSKQNHIDNRQAWNGVDLSDLNDEKIELIRKYYSANVQNIDNLVGEIIDALKKEGLYDNTVIVFSSDHGDYLGDYGMLGKGHFYKSSFGIPLIVKDPSTDHQTVSHPVSLVDVHNTILHFADIKTKDTADNTKLAPFGENNEREPIFGNIQYGYMLKDDKYLFSNYHNGIRELYDIVADPGQTVNLIDKAEYKELASEYQSKLSSKIIQGINKSNDDMNAKNNMAKTSGTDDPFNHKGWQRPYPSKTKS
ncbi:MAG: sulfatase-like hydrolase/transferase [Clostridia bacterium]